ncbi:MAG: hypothetical protein KDD61_15490 [Bdellovibrionales bacterium]|nr:hypothetical protein [Bdellovibrionales bacterium]
MELQKNAVILLVALVVILTTFQNCSNVNLAPIEQSVLVQANNQFCLKPPTGKIRYNNVLFVIDRSGSNAPHDVNLVSDPGNDPDEFLRGTAIEEYFNRHKNDPYYRWGFIFYSGQQISSYINQGNDRVPTFENSAVMEQAISDFYADSDVSGSFGTDYTASLALVENAIQNDLALNADKTEEEHIYTVLFASDGYPIENGSQKPITSMEDPRIKKIKTIVALPARHISLSTVYYARPDYPIDPTAAVRGLKYMAEAGKGSFSDVRETGRISFGDVLVGVRPEAWRIKRMRLVVFNLNSAACESGEIGTDSDSDGICDEDEIAYNNRAYYRSVLGDRRFDPQNRNSIDENYGDSFYWKFSLLPTGAGLEECSPDLRDDDKDFDFLNSCEEGMLHDQAANGPHADWKIPNNAANPLNPDSDGDAFLDWIEFSWFRLDSAFSAPVNYTNIADHYSTSVTGEILMAEHRHLIYPDQFKHSSYDTRLRFTGLNKEGENCYSFNQDQLELYPTKELLQKSQAGGYDALTHKAGENLILMYFIATPEQSPNSAGVLYHTIRKVDYGSPPFGHNGPLEIKPNLSGFSQYTIPEIYDSEESE